MPRDGSNIYSIPPGTEGIPDTTIASTKYNGFVHDVEADLNAARPIIAGGTGANNATSARDNLDAEVAAKQVTNYDSHTWETGSFFSLTAATGAPVAGTNLVGVCVIINNDPNYIDIVVRDHANGNVYTRRRAAGVWGAWVSEQASQDSRYINVTGDTMTGDLIISKVTPTLTLRRGDTSQAAIIGKNSANLTRWEIFLGEGTETGSNAGSAFSLRAFNDGGTLQNTPLTVERNTGRMTVSATGAGFIVSRLDAGGAQITYSTGGTARWSMGEGAGASDTSFNLYNHVTGIVAARWTQASDLLMGGLTAAVYTGGEKIGVESVGSFKAGVSIKCVDRGLFAFNTAASGYPMLIAQGTSGNNVGSITCTTTTTAFNTTSDMRLKEDLKSFSAGNIIDDTNVYDFAWKSTGERSYGIIAQQANEIYPAAVVHEEVSDRWMIDYSKYVPVMLQELKALRARVAELEGKLGAKPS